MVANRRDEGLNSAARGFARGPPLVSHWHANPISSEDSRRRWVFRVKGIDPSGRIMTFACGTDEQAMEKTWELLRRGFRDVVVINPKGQERPAAAFERSLGIDWDA